MAIRYLVHDDKGEGHLPVSGEDGKPDHHLMGAAWAALHSGYRGNKYEGPGKEEALAKLKALYKSEGMETPGETTAAETEISSESQRLSGEPQISVAYRQPGGRTMKTMKLKCLTDAHIEKHGLEACDKGKIGVFDGDELVGMADDIAGWQPNSDKKEALSEVFASEIGLPGKSPAEIALLVKLAQEQPVDHFAVLSECLADGKLDLAKAGKLADAGKVKFSSILLAEEAQGKIEADIKAGKVLPKNRQHALKLYLSDPAGYAALVTEGPAQVDLAARGHAGGGERECATRALMTEVHAYKAANNCSVAQALSEVSKTKPHLWREYTKEVQVTLVKTGDGGTVDEDE